MVEAPPRRHPALLIFAEDWGRHVSGLQHLTRQLLDRYDVYWVNTIGTRRPGLNWRSVRRAWEKAQQWLHLPVSPNPLPVNLRVVSPVMWPWFTTVFDRKVNLIMLRRQLTRLLQSLPEPPIAVTKIPIVADLMGVLPVKHWVYYCVDDFSQWPGLDQPTLGRMEELVVQRADRLIAAGEALQERLAKMGRHARLLTHGVDRDFWTTSQNSDSLPALGGLERPLVAFWGLIDRRMDLAFVQRLAAEMTSGTIVLVGPEADPDPALSSCPRVVRLKSLPFADLPKLAHEAAVLIMPYADLPVTHAMQPLKLKEYLATGKPAVVRDLPATHGWSDCLDLADTPQEFSQAVRLRLATGLPPSQALARERLVGESWAEKARIFERLALQKDPAQNAVLHS